MIPLGCFFLSMQMGRKILLACKGCRVDSLQHGIEFTPPKICPSVPRQFEMPETASTRHMRTATHVHKLVGVAIEADLCAATDFTIGLFPRGSEFHKHPLVGVISHELQCSV